MPDANGNGRGLFTVVTPALLVQIVTIGAMFAGNWYLMGERIQNNTDATRELKAQVVAMDDRLDNIERTAATLEVRFENLRDVVTELRRQSGLRPIPQSPVARPGG